MRDTARCLEFFLKTGFWGGYSRGSWVLTRHVRNGSNGDSASPGAGERWRRRTANSWSAWQSRREKPVKPREGGAEGDGEVSKLERSGESKNQMTNYLEKAWASYGPNTCIHHSCFPTADFTSTSTF